jgi:uncharacterized protein YkwD
LEAIAPSVRFVAVSRANETLMRPWALLPSFGIASCLAIPAARAATPDPLGVLNDVRQHQCGSRDAALTHVATLDAAAKGIAEGKSLREAVGASGYRAVSATLLTFTGVRDNNELVRLVAESCARIAPAALDDAGFYQRDGKVWIVLAQPYAVPSLDPAATAKEMLELVNRTRTAPRRCGDTEFKSAPPLEPSTELEKAAAVQAKDMAMRGSLSHTGQQGSTPGDRVTQAGYAWAAVGENIAGGQREAQGALQSWLASPGHCANLMNPQYTEMGVAFATNAKSDLGIYWSLVFATPLKPAKRR